jgi:hypothetical protein
MRSNQAMNFIRGLRNDAISGAAGWGTLGAVSAAAINHGHYKRREKVYHSFGYYGAHAALWGAGAGAAFGALRAFRRF